MRILIILAIICCAGIAEAGSVSVVVGQPTAAASASTYVGWANSDGTPTGTPSSTYSALTATNTSTWTATENGTAKSIQFYAGATRWAPGSAWVLLYRNISGTITLVGRGTVTGVSAGSWSGKFTLTAEAGQSLAFSTNDVLYYGVGWYDANNTQYVGRNDTGGTGMFYSETSLSSGPLATITFSTSSGRLMSHILEYE
jgi:hypothetical protein